MFFTLGPAAFHMLLRGLKIWAFAEADGLRLSIRKLFGGRPKANAEVEETTAEVGSRNAEVEEEAEEEAEVGAAR